MNFEIGISEGILKNVNISDELKEKVAKIEKSLTTTEEKDKIVKKLKKGEYKNNLAFQKDLKKVKLDLSYTDLDNVRE